MKFLSRFPRRGHQSTRSQMRSKATFRPGLELLEERTLLSAAPIPAGLQPRYGQLPLAFTINEGQAASPINYLAQGSGYSIALTAQQAQVSLGQGNASTTLKLQLTGANTSAQAIGQNQLITKTNYLIGTDSSKWLTNLANYGQVEYQNVYHGIDAVYFGNQGRLETTFLVHPGANANVIQMQIQGAKGLSLDAQGNLVIHTSGGYISELAPVMYQNINGTRQAVSGHYVLDGNNTVGFQIGTYDHSQTLVIDPTLSYSSYLTGPGWGITVDGTGDAYIAGGYTTGSLGVYVAKVNATGTALDWITNLGKSGFGTGIAVDASGDVYVAGYSADSAFPTTPNALATSMPSSTQPGFLTVLSASGSGPLYSTWLPGTSFAGVGAIRVNGPALAIDNAGDPTGQLDNVYLTGAASSGLLTTAGAYQPNFAGGTYSPSRNAFLAKIDPNLSGSTSLLYGSYLGGSLNDNGYNGGNAGMDEGTGIAVDSSDNAYIVGRTYSTNFPTTPGAYQQTNNGGLDAFVAKFNPSLSGTASLVYSTYLGGSGSDGYWTDYPANLSVVEPGPGIAVDAAGDAYVTGTTTSTNFPTTPGAFQTTYNAQTSGWGLGDAFVTKLNPTGTGLVYSTYLGGSDNSGGTAIALDTSGNAYVTGWTRSTNFPTVNPIQAQKGSGVDSNNIPVSNVFVTTLNNTGTGLLFSTYFGGNGGSFNKKGVFSGSNGDVYGYALALDSANNVYVTGSTSAGGEPISTSLPTTTGAFDTTPGGGLAFKIDPPVESSSTTPHTPSSIVPSNGPATVIARNPQGQESTSPSAPSPANPLFTLPGNNPGFNAAESVLSVLQSEWQSLESALLARFDALLSMGYNATMHKLGADNWMQDILFVSLTSLNAT